MSRSRPRAFIFAVVLLSLRGTSGFIACSRPPPAPGRARQPRLSDKQPLVSQPVAAALGSLGVGSFLFAPLVTALARLGLIADLPPLNTFTDISNAAMDAAIAEGSLQPLLATAWAQGFYWDLFRQYSGSGLSAEAWVERYCSAHESLCAGLL